MKRKCAIFQFEGVHEEVVPSLVHSLNSNGFSPDVFLSARCKSRGDLFETLNGLDCKIEYPEIESRKAWQDLKTIAANGGYEFIVMSTFQRESVANWAMDTGLPIYGVVHNAQMFLGCDACMTALGSGQAKLICLAPHVAAFLNQRLDLKHVDDVAVVQSVYWGDLGPKQDAGQSDARLIAIPGGVNFKTRGYDDLLQCLKQSKPRTQDGKTIRFAILGGGADRDKLEQIVTEEKLEEHFLFAPLGHAKRVLYDDYINILRRSDVLLPLAPLAFAPYREHKITSAIPTAIGFGLPLVLDRWTQRVYQTPAIESDAEIAATIETCAVTSQTNLVQAAERMRELRTEILERNAAEFDRLLGL